MERNQRRNLLPLSADADHDIICRIKSSVQFCRQESQALKLRATS